MMNNSEGYCWLQGIEAAYGGLTSNQDSVYLTFDSKWNWIFVGSAAYGHDIWAWAFCQPWSSLHGTGGAYYGYSFGPGKSDVIPTYADSICSLGGVQGALLPYAGYGSVWAGIDIDYEDFTRRATSTIPTASAVGQCAVLAPTNSISPNFVISHTNVGTQTTFLGSSTQMMCTLNALGVGPNSYEPYMAYLYLDSSNNYWFYTGSGGSDSSATVQCISL
jgi:hypothetical protein